MVCVCGGGGGGGGGLELVNFFSTKNLNKKNPNLKKIYFFCLFWGQEVCVCVWGGGLEF